jgi:hypothetical protein
VQAEGHNVYPLALLSGEKEAPMNFPYCRAAILSLSILFVFCTPPAARCETPVELRDPNGGNNNFGWSLAVSGNTAVIGAPAGSGSPGAAYVFTRTPIGWRRVAELTASDGGSADAFGFSVGISGNTVVVGAFSHTVGSNSQQGAVYIFVEPASGWSDMTETAELTAADGLAGDRLGYSVAMYGNTVVAGAANATPGAIIYQGSAYIFLKPATGWSTTSSYKAKLTASDPVPGAHFGWSVAITGDTLVIGAYDAGCCGAAYVFVKPAGGWSDSTETAELTASDGVSYDFFGWSVAISGSTICVGANQFDSSVGKAYVFQEPAQGWVSMKQTAELTPSDGVPFEDFGVSVAISDTAVAVGATDTTSGPGSAYIFLQPAGGWQNATQNSKISPSISSPYNYFGQSIFYNGKAMLVGAPYATVDGDRAAGVVYVF